MGYLVEVTYKNAHSPIHQYYNTFTDIYQTILQNNDIEFIEVYALDKEKTNTLTKKINENKK